MHEESGVTAVELFEERFERRVTEICLAGVGEHDDPVDTEFVVAKGELVERSGDVGCRREPKSPNRPGYASATRLPSSFTWRASVLAAASSPKCTPGEEIDSRLVAIPSRSISATCDPASHTGTGMPSTKPKPAAPRALP